MKMHCEGFGMATMMRAGGWPLGAATLAAVLLLSRPGACGLGDAPEVEWVKIFDGAHNDAHGVGAYQAGDGGFVVAGTAWGEIGYYFVLSKTDAGGETAWTRTVFVGAAGWAVSLCETMDGGSVVAGFTWDSRETDEEDVVLVRTDSEGAVLWARAYEESGSQMPRSVAETDDGGFVVAGSASSSGAGYRDFLLMRTDADGNLLWSRTFGSPGDDRCEDVRATRDGGFILVGSRSGLDAGWGYLDTYLVKTDEAGSEVWSRNLGREGDDVGAAVRQPGDGSYIVLGSSFSLSSSDEGSVRLIRTDEQGREVWSRTLGVPGPMSDSGKSLELAAGDGYILSTCNGIVRTDEEGLEVWSLAWDAAGAARGPEGWYIGDFVRPAREGGYIATGSVDTDDDDRFDVFLLRLGPDLPETPPRFIRGDTNGDATLDIADAVRQLIWLFLGGAALPCRAAGDVNGDADLDLSDPVYGLMHLFLGGPPPVAPFPECGPFHLETDSELGCSTPPADCQ